MERVAADILGLLPETENGNKYILVISDYFTKWMEAVSIPGQTAVTVTSVLVEEGVCRFGAPAYVHSDQCRQFEGIVYKEMCKLLGIKKTRTMPYHPESDGMVERYNKTLAKLLSAFVNEEHTDWDQLLPYVMMAYRSSEHETKGFTPKKATGKAEFVAHIDNIKSYESRLEDLVEKDERNEVESEI